MLSPRQLRPTLSPRQLRPLPPARTRGGAHARGGEGGVRARVPPLTAPQAAQEARRAAAAQLQARARRYHDARELAFSMRGLGSDLAFLEPLSRGAITRPPSASARGTDGSDDAAGLAREVRRLRGQLRELQPLRKELRALKPLVHQRETGARAYPLPAGELGGGGDGASLDALDVSHFGERRPVTDHPGRRGLARADVAPSGLRAYQTPPPPAPPRTAPQSARAARRVAHGGRAAGATLPSARQGAAAPVERAPVRAHEDAEGESDGDGRWKDGGRNGGGDSNCIAHSSADDGTEVDAAGGPALARARLAKTVAATVSVVKTVRAIKLSMRPPDAMPVPPKPSDAAGAAGAATLAGGARGADASTSSFFDCLASRESNAVDGGAGGGGAGAVGGGAGAVGGGSTGGDGGAPRASAPPAGLASTVMKMEMASMRALLSAAREDGEKGVAEASALRAALEHARGDAAAASAAAEAQAALVAELRAEAASARELAAASERAEHSAAARIASLEAELGAMAARLDERAGAFGGAAEPAPGALAAPTSAAPEQDARGQAPALPTAASVAAPPAPRASAASDSVAPTAASLDADAHAGTGRVPSA